MAKSKKVVVEEVIPEVIEEVSSEIIAIEELEIIPEYTFEVVNGTGASQGTFKSLEEAKAFAKLHSFIVK